jgi:glycosyltransferase involved in cell wall biosynthesis
MTDRPKLRAILFLSTIRLESFPIKAFGMPRALNILHLVSLQGMGGRAATALRQIRLLAARGHHLMVGCLPGTSVESRSRQMGVEVFPDFQFRRGLHPKSFWHDCRRLVEICDTRQVDVIHAHLSQESWVACLAARLPSRRPVVIRSRGVVVKIKPHAFNRLMHNTLTDTVVTPSRVIYDHLCALPGFDATKVLLIADGVDLERFSPANDGGGIRREFGIPPGAPLAVMVARLERVKGHEIFFNALAQLLQNQRVPGLRALCACDERTPGALDAAVRQARELGVPEDVLQFTGMRPDVENIIAAANVIALPSLGSEGSSRVALEAGAGGIPVVASSAGCLPEVIQNGQTGRIVPTGDAAGLADALQELLNDPAAARRMGAAARLRVKSLYGEQQMADQLEALYIRALAQREGRLSRLLTKKIEEGRA